MNAPHAAARRPASRPAFWPALGPAAQHARHRQTAPCPRLLRWAGLATWAQAVAQHLVRVLALLVAGLWAVPAQAGQACDSQPPTVDQVRQGLALAEATARALDASGAPVAVLARAGQDLSAHGIRWSHLGLVLRSTLPDGRPGPWRVVHKLNHCGAADAAVYRQGLAEFFLDSPHRYEAVLLPLAPALHATLAALLADDRLVSAVHEPRYSLVAYPWAQTYQQSNQWVAETLAVAAEPGVRTRRQAQAWLQLRGYQPTVLRLGPLTRLGARATRANVAFDDHPNAERFADRIATTTADSVLDWLQASALAGPPVLVR